MTLSSLFDSTMISSRVLHGPVERYLSIVLVLIPSGFTAFAHEQGYRYNIPAGVNIASGLQVGRGHRLYKHLTSGVTIHMRRMPEIL